MGLVLKMYSNESKGGKFPPRFGRWDKDRGPDYRDVDCWSAIDGSTIYPEYMSDIAILVCPSDAEMSGDESADLCEGGWSRNIATPYIGLVATAGDCNGDTIPEYVRTPDVCYMYWGRTVNPEWFSPAHGDVVNNYFIVGEWIDDEIATVRYRDSDESVELEDGTEVTSYILREGIERFFITDINNPAASNVAQSTLGIFYDTTPRIAVAAGETMDAMEFNHVPGGGNVLFMDGHVEFVKYGAEPAGPGYMWSKEGEMDEYDYFP
jgi:prepilin-type processing-associated H-X9-DG protein